MTTGQIHDLGYKRYVGTRRSIDTRWVVIMRHHLATAWKTWWRFKLWLVAGAMATAVASGFLYFASGRMFRMLGSLSGEVVRFADGILPLSTLWYCKVGFVISLTVGSTVVASDLQSGAFTFYFARSLRPRDYVVGKLAGMALLVALVMLGGPLVLAALRLGLSDDFDQLVEMLPVVYKALVIGGLGTLIYAVVPLGASAVLANQRHALALWATYYLVVGWMAQGIGRVTTPAVAALDLAAALNAVSFDLFDVRFTGRQPQIPMVAAVLSIAAHAVVAVGLVAWRVRSAQRTGVGGSS